MVGALPASVDGTTVNAANQSALQKTHGHHTCTMFVVPDHDGKTCPKDHGCLQELLKAMSLTGGLALPTWALFYFIGTCLWAFYRAFPNPNVAGLLPDAVFPNFILHVLPPGMPLPSLIRCNDSERCSSGL